MNTEKWYRYRRSARILENNTVLKNSSSKDFKLFTTIRKKIIVELSSRQVVTVPDFNDLNLHKHLY